MLTLINNILPSLGIEDSTNPTITATFEIVEDITDDVNHHVLQVTILPECASDFGLALMTSPEVRRRMEVGKKYVVQVSYEVGSKLSIGNMAVPREEDLKILEILKNQTKLAFRNALDLLEEAIEEVPSVTSFKADIATQVGNHLERAARATNLEVLRLGQIVVIPVCCNCGITHGEESKPPKVVQSTNIPGLGTTMLMTQIVGVDREPNEMPIRMHIMHDHPFFNLACRLYLAAARTVMQEIERNELGKVMKRYAEVHAHLEQLQSFD